MNNAISLWRLPPQPELLDTVAEPPSPKFVKLHPFFIWKPESHIMVLRGLAPSYLEELVTRYQPNRPLRYQNAGLPSFPRV
ncbi:hypothetical protein D4764_0226110 [Takifugu flavidus]|uniref:Uncharacterized protein n=1 Tax=Takifugu flavidus TaxID=433684 RepID=A0A5C6MGU2_9TELE|nr:hypothetical protein D4764_0226110 [Takifugu flavidus]